ncbi:MAG TPA: UbiA-like polyprenyltransferase [Candidatus Krumholzibacteria bacterium]|nr:UbiA-like polyprenyltransferase [Candidatus Krumholzibacteria bacterium]
MRRIKDLLDTIKFEHTVFALPFAMLSLLLAADGFPSLHDFAWVLVAMVGARSSAMMMNRIADRHIDAENPRTATRQLPTARVGLGSAWAFTIGASIAFLVAAWKLDPLALRLAPVALALVWAYSWTKRFTWVSHLWLGLGLALAPLGAWIAVRGRLDGLPLLLGAGVLLWVAGFDTIYACQDVDFDRRRGLRSLPARFGLGTALRLAQVFHVGMLAVFAAIGLLYDFGWLYAAGLVLVAALVVAQHAIVAGDVRHGDLRHIDVAFFNVNSIVGVLLMAFALADRFLLG